MTDNWNVDSLKEYTDALFDEYRKGVDYRFDAIKQAIEKSDGYTKYRDEKQNEFRKTLDDQNLTFVRKSDHQNLEKQVDIWVSGIKQVQQANFEVLRVDISKLEKAFEKTQNIKQGGNFIWPWVVTIIMTLIAVISFIIKL